MAKGVLGARALIGLIVLGVFPGIVHAQEEASPACSLQGGKLECIVADRQSLDAALVEIRDNVEQVDEYVVVFTPENNATNTIFLADPDRMEESIVTLVEGQPCSMRAGLEDDELLRGASPCIPAPIRFTSNGAGGKAFLTTRPERQAVEEEDTFGFGLTEAVVEAITGALGFIVPGFGSDEEDALPVPPRACFDSVNDEPRPRLFSIERDGNFIFENLFLCDANVADGDGGAIRLNAPSTALLDLDSVFLLNNRASGNGGALAVSGGQHSLRIRNSSVSGNTAGVSGGSISLASGRAVIISTTIGPYLLADAPLAGLPGNNASVAGAGIAVLDTLPGEGEDNSLGRRAAIDLENVSILGNQLNANAGLVGGPAIAFIYREFPDNPTTPPISKSLNSTIALNRIPVPDDETSIPPAIFVQIANNSEELLQQVFRGTLENPFAANIIAGNTTIPEADDMAPVELVERLSGGFGEVAFEFNIFGNFLPDQARNDLFRAGPNEGLLSRGATAPTVLALGHRSEARDSADTPRALFNDQRGAPTQGGIRDAGAYEFAGLGSIRFAPPLDRGYTVFEPSMGSGTNAVEDVQDAPIRLVREGNLTTTVSVQFRTVDGTIEGAVENIEAGTATPDQGLILRDYAPVPPTPFSFTAGETQREANVTVRSDGIEETEEGVILLLKQPLLVHENGQNTADVDSDLRSALSGTPNILQACRFSSQLPFTACASDLLNIRDRERVQFDRSGVFSSGPPASTSLDGDVVSLQGQRGGFVELPVNRLGPIDFDGSVRCRTRDPVSAGFRAATPGVEYQAVDDQLQFFNNSVFTQTCFVQIEPARADVFVNEATAFDVELALPQGRNRALDALPDNNGLAIGSPNRVRVTIAPSNPSEAQPTRYEFEPNQNTVFDASSGNGGINVRRLGTDARPDRDYRVTVEFSGEVGVLSDSSPITLTWAPNDFEPKTIPINLSSSSFDGDRNVRVALFNPQPINASQIGTPLQLALTLRGETPPAEMAPTVSMNSPTVTIQGNTATATISAVRSGDPTGSLTVDFNTVAGTALAGIDYEETSGRLSWGDGESGERQISVPLLSSGDEYRAEKEFSVRLSSVGGTATMASPNILVSPAETRVILGQRGVASLSVFPEAPSLDPPFFQQTLTLSLNGRPSGNVTVRVDTSDGVSTGSSSTVVFTPDGALERNITLRVPTLPNASLQSPLTISVQSSQDPAFRNLQVQRNVAINVPVNNGTQGGQRDSGGGSMSWFTILAAFWLLALNQYRRRRSTV